MYVHSAKKGSGYVHVCSFGTKEQLQTHGSIFES